jgi:hypothetical protein
MVRVYVRPTVKHPSDDGGEVSPSDGAVVVRIVGMVLGFGVWLVAFHYGLTHPRHRVIPAHQAYNTETGYPLARSLSPL